jgi:hypothetical protein
VAAGTHIMDVERGRKIRRMLEVPNPQTQISISLVGLKYDSKDHNISRNINIICDHVDDKND